MGKCFEPSSSSPSSSGTSYTSRIKIMKPAMEGELDFTATASPPDLRLSDGDLSVPVVKLFANNTHDDIASLKSRIQSTNTISDKATTNCYKDLSYPVKINLDGLFVAAPIAGEGNGAEVKSTPDINGSDGIKTSILRCGTEINSSVNTTTGGISGHNIPFFPKSCTRSANDRQIQNIKHGCSNVNKTNGGNTDPAAAPSPKNLENGSRQWKTENLSDGPMSEQVDRLSSIDLNSDDGDDSINSDITKQLNESQVLSNSDSKSHEHDPQRRQQQQNQFSSLHPQAASRGTPISAEASTFQQTLSTTSSVKGDTSRKGRDKNIKTHLVNNRSLELPLTNGLTQMVESNFAAAGGVTSMSVGSHNSNIATPGTSCATTPSMSPIDDVTVMVGKNGKLSTVLENIPLLYIPTTKQLVSKDWPRVTNISNNPQQDIKYVPMTRKFPTDEDCLSSTKDYAEVEPGFSTSLHRVDASSLSSLSGRDYTEIDPGLNSSSLHRVDASSLSSLSGRDYSEVRIGSLHQVDASSLSSLSTGTDLACGGSVGSDDYSAGPSGCSSSGVNYHGDEPHHSSCRGLESGFGCGAKSKTSNQSKVADSLESSLVEVNLFSRNSYEPIRSLSASSSSSSSTSQEKKVENRDFTKRKSHGITGFLGSAPHINTSLARIQPQQSQVKLSTQKNLFRRSKDTSTKQQAESAPGWKLFGKIPPKESAQKDANQISDEYHAKQKASQLVAARARKDIEVMSTTALILENRPGNLPSKAPEEERKHKQEYEAMVEAAKKKEQKDIRQKKKNLQQQLKHEEQLVAAAKTWNSEVLPNWEVTKQTKRARDLWWNGLPPSVRGRVWKLAIGNELNITSELYEICLNRAKDRIKLLSEESHGFAENSADPPSNKEASVELIKLDVSRTFPQFCIFQKGGPYHDLLHSLLGAYACYRPDVGYVQGMSFLAAVLLLNMDVADAFICFANLLNGPCQVAFFRVDEGMMKSYFDTYDEFFLENMPQLHRHFEKQCLTPDIYIIDWIFTIFSRSLPLDVACRVWDVFCRDGEEFLFRTALGILHLYQSLLLDMDFIHLAQFLTKLPEDISSDQLFRNIQAIRLSIDKKKFAQVLAGHREARERSDYF
ncbi:TBC1D14 [Acanthosepion pharaonis]|uniref:TBC1D14 n=1 Tax=Acanthosepion pharaonis TaxID=158019 RepID=A0A812CSJ2_ACAPH|nr:TBC1D14 [Sepia pharaonis]